MVLPERDADRVVSSVIMKSVFARIVISIAVLAAGCGIGWAVYQRIMSLGGDTPDRGGTRPVPIEVAAIETGPITYRRTFSGTLEAPARFVVAPKVGGRIVELHVDLADTVARGQVVAELDNAEYVQAVHGAEASLAVAKASLTEAENALKIAEREMQRVQTLHDRGVASDSQYDAARAELLGRQSQVEVARAQVEVAGSSLQAARIRLSYTTVTADWTGGADQRVIGHRYVTAGDTVAANAPLLSIVELSPIMGVIYVTEKDHARLQPGQPVTLVTDAYPGRTFAGHVARIAPGFDERSRQARVEVIAANDEHLLKPGNFMRATVVLERHEQATIVPAQAVTRRDDRDGVFLVDRADIVARWQPVELGIREGDRIQILTEGLRGEVVTLGQQMVDDGSSIIIPDTSGADDVPAQPEREAHG